MNLRKIIPRVSEKMQEMQWITVYSNEKHKIDNGEDGSILVRRAFSLSSG